MLSPSLVDDVTGATRALVEQQAAPGLYHCVNTGYASWFDVTNELRQLGGFPPGVLAAGRAADTVFPAPRPMFAALSNHKLRDAGIAMPSWQDALARYVTGRRRN